MIFDRKLIYTHGWPSKSMLDYRRVWYISIWQDIHRSATSEANRLLISQWRAIVWGTGLWHHLKIAVPQLHNYTNLLDERSAWNIKLFAVVCFWVKLVVIWLLVVPIRTSRHQTLEVALSTSWRFHISNWWVFWTITAIFRRMTHSTFWLGPDWTYWPVLLTIFNWFWHQQLLQQLLRIFAEPFRCG